MMMGGNDTPQVLRVEPCRERGEAHEVAEHHRELAALGRCGSGLMRRGAGWIHLSNGLGLCFIKI
jgi:hypothetical protein